MLILIQYHILDSLQATPLTSRNSHRCQRVFNVYSGSSQSITINNAVALQSVSSFIDDCRSANLTHTITFNDTTTTTTTTTTAFRVATGFPRPVGFRFPHIRAGHESTFSVPRKRFRSILLPLDEKAPYSTNIILLQALSLRPRPVD